MPPSQFRLPKPRKHMRIEILGMRSALTMQQAVARAEDLKLDTQRRFLFKGSALVRFEYLGFRKRRQGGKVFRNRVERLKRIFKAEGCRPLDFKHHIPARVDQDRLNVALNDARQKGRWGTDELPRNHATVQAGYPELEFPGGIECLRGRVRIEAGKEFLHPSEKWWIVDLYPPDISYELEEFLVEGNDKAEKPCDGKIYRKILECKSLPSRIDLDISPTTCTSIQSQWWARLDKRAVKLRSLFKNSTLTTDFDFLSAIPGLFDDGMMVTTLNKLLGMKLDEVSKHQ